MDAKTGRNTTEDALLTTAGTPGRLTVERTMAYKQKGAHSSTRDNWNIRGRQQQGRKNSGNNNYRRDVPTTAGTLETLEQTVH
jgi:hypothetical protein